QLLPESLHNWIARALQIDVRQGFLSATDAQIGLEEALADDTGFVAAPVALETFLSRYIAALLEPVMPLTASNPPVPVPEPVAACEPPKPTVETPKVAAEPPKPVAPPKPLAETPKPIVEPPKAAVEPPKPVVAAPLAPKADARPEPKPEPRPAGKPEARDI